MQGVTWVGQKAEVGRGGWKMDRAKQSGEVLDEVVCPVAMQKGDAVHNELGASVVARFAQATVGNDRTAAVAE